MPLSRRPVIAGLLAWPLAAPSRAALLQPGDDPQASPIWQKVRASLFDNRPIQAASADELTLEAPNRAIDAAVVPVAIRSRLPQTAQQWVTRLVLVVDANPSPIGALFQLTPGSGRADIETRIRVDAYSHVRAIAETSDGRILMTTRFIKASGGCSAPATGDTAVAAIGQMRLRVVGDVDGREPVLAQLQIEHPNHSGLAMDQSSRQYTPAHFVRHVDATLDGNPVFAADVDFSISENPNFRFFLRPRRGAELRVSVVDTHDRRFVTRQVLGEVQP
jgi:sulfur-oxidizing protein SoxY